AAICTPPLGLGLATLLRRKIWSETERESGYAALGMGMMGITEGAIPFAVSDPFRVIPSIMLGSMAAAMTAMQFGVADHAPHGGPIVLPVVDERLWYVVAIIVGMIVTSASVIALKSIGKREGVAV
ncbi:MAG: PTS fructose transporter subunit IIBC, partial [Phycisphaerales bacterium]|nr:PTS fructose transporter subunit IIBC [Phycisphaerales bacterium]